jgi:serine/threonine-protein kinase
MNAVNPAAEAATPKACPSCGARYTADALFCPLDGSPLTTSPGAIAAAAATDPYVGREILGHIEIRQLVGIGAMGRVYRAFQKGIDRDVAVKILHRELSANQMLVARFHREAKVASRLAHPHVVHVLLVGQLPDGAMYIVMEYLDGMSLQSALAGVGGAMPLPRALHIALQLCDAAGEAHAQGIVHRDLKPENVMLIRRADDPDFVKVLDFGIARLNWGEQSMATAAGLIFGTARYISPEGAQGEKVGPQGDVYSIATILYQCLCGRTPFDGDQAVALLVQQIHDPPSHLKSVPRAAYVPDPIADVIMANLGKEARTRAESARVLGRTLLESAVASGLSAQDILARPAMAGHRGQQTSVVQMASMHRTRQLPLEPGVASRIEAAASEGRGQVRTEIAEPAALAPAAHAQAHTQAHAQAHTQAHAQALPPGSETTKWTPPADFETKLVPPQSGGVDRTMDDQQLSTRTAPLATPPPRAATPLATPPPSSATAPTAPPRYPTPAPSSSRPSFVELARPALSPAAARVLMLVVVCFLVGAIGAGGFAYRAGLIGSRSRAALMEAALARANDALSHDRWDTPPGDNVRDILADAQQRWPGEPQIARVRGLAAEKLVSAAAARHDAGDAAEAAHLIAVAQQVDPSSERAKKLAADWAVHEPATPAESSLPPLLASGRSLPGSSAAAQGTRVTVDASNGKPVPGQPVDFSARIVASSGAHPRVDSAAFHVTGPGVAPGTQLVASDDGSGIYRTTFAFLQGGRFEVSFAARADGAAVRGTRVVVVGQPKASLPGPPAAGDSPAPPGPVPPAPPPTGSVKWL